MQTSPEHVVEKCSCNELYSTLAVKYKESDYSTRLQLLTLAPKTWSVNQTKSFFKCSWAFAKKAMKLRDTQGILSTPTLRVSTKKLDEDVINTIKDFFKSSQISRMMPGVNDTVVVRENGTKSKKQKHLMLMNLNEAYALFKTDYPQLKVGSSAFCDNRPPECQLLGSKGSHVVCVCIHHQNVKLMHQSFQKLNPESNHKDQMKLLMCAEPNEKCHMLECDSCPPLEDCVEKFIAFFDQNGVENIEYKSWLHTDRTTLSMSNDSVEDFCSKYASKLNDLLKHDFISKKQSNYYENAKKNLKDDEVIVHLDFSENFSHLSQESVQSEYYAQTQTTIHPIMVYYKKDGKLEHKSYVVISDVLEHDSKFVRSMQLKIVPIIQALVPNVKKIHFWSDGAGSQYKNKFNFYYLSQYKEKFNIHVEWNFFATAHGKGVVDGIGAIIKRFLRNAIIKGQVINNAKEAYQVLLKYYKNQLTKSDTSHTTEPVFLSKAEISKIRLPNNQNLSSIEGTRSFHTVISSSEHRTLIFKPFFDSANSVEVKF